MTPFSTLEDHGIGCWEAEAEGLFPPIFDLDVSRRVICRFTAGTSKWWNHDDPSERYDYL